MEQHGAPHPNPPLNNWHFPYWLIQNPRWLLPHLVCGVPGESSNIYAKSMLFINCALPQIPLPPAPNNLRPQFLARSSCFHACPPPSNPFSTVSLQVTNQILPFLCAKNLQRLLTVLWSPSPPWWPSRPWGSVLCLRLWPACQSSPCSSHCSLLFLELAPISGPLCLLFPSNILSPNRE